MLQIEKKVEKKKTYVNLTVIDEVLIIKAVKDYHHQNNIIANLENIQLSQLDILQLSYKNILKIQNLDGLNNLTKLQLDNNLIEKIHNLDHLVKLKWLDLSFNCIKKIEGLEKLTQLEDLSLFNNQITVVEGLENNKKLNVFSIGNNKLESFESLKAIFGKGSKHKYLQVLNVAGNPFTTTDQDYTQHLIFYILNLKYLDYIYIDDNTRQKVNEDDKFSSEMINYDSYKIQLANDEKAEIELQKQMKELSEARMDIIADFDKEIINDQDLEKIRCLKGIEEEIQKFQEKVKEQVDMLQKAVVEKNQNKKKNIEQFLQAVKARERISEQQTIEIIRKYEKRKKYIVRKYESSEDNWAEDLEQLMEDLDATKKELFEIEVVLMDDLDHACKNIDSTLSEFVKNIEEIKKPHIMKIQEIINKEFYSKIHECSKQQFDKYNDDYQAGRDMSGWDENEQTVLLLSNFRSQITKKVYCNYQVLSEKIWIQKWLKKKEKLLD